MADTIDVSQLLSEIARGDTEPGHRASQILSEIARGDTEPGVIVTQFFAEVAYRVIDGRIYLIGCQLETDS